jgi:valacyclovir hydrolase
MPQVTVNSTVLHYEEAGAGEPLLLLHGGLGTALLHWWREIPFFAQHYRVIAPDMRGYGRSSPPREFPPDFYHRDAEDMAALLDALAVHPAHVLGWSDGGIVALVLAVKHPRLVRTLTVAGGESFLLPEEREAWQRIIDTSTWSDSALRRFVEAQGPLNWPAILERMLAGYIGVLERNGGEIIRARLGEIRCPTLIVHGEDDPTVPVSHAHVLHESIAGSRLHVYPNTGHLPHREHEEDFRRRVLDFLREQGAGRTAHRQRPAP